MKKLVFISCLSLFIPLILFAADDIQIQDNTPFWYVHMDRQADWTQVDTAIAVFLSECRRQGIQEQISGPLFQIIFDEKMPLWGIGYPLKDKISVQHPLQVSSYDYAKVAVRSYSGEYYGLALVFHKMRLYTEEKEMELIGPMIAFYHNNIEHINTADYIMKVMMPVHEQARITIITNRIYNLVLSTASFLYLLFAAFLFFHKRGKRLSNIIFSIFLIAYAMSLINWFIYNYRYFLYDSFPHLFDIGSSFSFLVPPLLYLYTRSQVYADFRMGKIYMINFLPFILDLIYRSYRFYLLSGSLKRDLFISNGIYTDFEIIFRSSVLDLQNICYIVAALILLYSYRRKIKRLFSSIEKINLSWLQTVLYGYLLIYIIGMVKHKIFILSGIYVGILGLALIFSFLIFVVVIVIKGLQQPEIFSGIVHNINKNKYERSKLSQKDRELYLNRLLNYMEIQKPYLNPIISLKDLAEHMPISPHYLSQIINECLHKNFFDFINGYRINNCKELFKDSTQNDKSILEIAYSVGFNSKSVFNHAFRKFIGMTPSQFRKQVSTGRQLQEL